MLGGDLVLPAATTSHAGAIYRGADPAIHWYSAPETLGDNIFIGRLSGNFTLGPGGGGGWLASNNLGFGPQTGESLTTGYTNVMIGLLAGRAITSGFDNTIVGSCAGDNTTTGNSNSFYGADCGTANISGDWNAYFGAAAGNAATVGSRNSSLGAKAGLVATTGDDNIRIGYASGYGLNLGQASITGSRTVFIGVEAGLTEGHLDPDNVIVIGYRAKTLDANTTVIGNADMVATSVYGRLGTSLAGTLKANVDALTLTNRSNALDMDGTTTSILFQQWYYDAAEPAAAPAARITVGTETDWTSTASTRDAYLALGVALDGTITERLRIKSSGSVSLSGLTTQGPVIVGEGGAIASEATLAIARGGTNANATPTAGAIAYGSGTAYAFTSAGSTGQALLSAGAGTPTWGTLGNACGGTGANSSTWSGMVKTSAGTWSAVTGRTREPRRRQHLRPRVGLLPLERCPRRSRLCEHLEHNGHELRTGGHRLLVQRLQDQHVPRRCGDGASHSDCHRGEHGHLPGCRRQGRHRDSGASRPT
jgi:hypothetical protein